MTAEIPIQPANTQQDPTRTKTCPSCGATLFADMDICYGCLYDFTKTYEPPQIGGADEVPLDMYEQLPQMQEKEKEANYALQEIPATTDKTTIDSSGQSPYVLQVCGPSVNLSFGCSNQGICLLTFNAASGHCEKVGLDKGTKINLSNLVFTVQ